MKFIAHFKFTEEDIAYLKSIPSLKNCEPEFFNYLSTLDCSQVEVRAQEHGAVVFPKVPFLTVRGPMIVCQLLETTLLNLVNFPSLLATNAARMIIEARGQFSEKLIYDKAPTCAEFGLRRAQGPDGAFSASKYCMVGGFDAIANVMGGQKCGWPVIGTHAHSYVMSFDSLDQVKGRKVKDLKTEKEVELLELVLKYRKELNYVNLHEGELAAFIAYALSFPHGFLCLVDTYDTLSGVKNFLTVALAMVELGYKPRGVRLDSGDLAKLSIETHKLYEEIAEKYNCKELRDLDVVASNDINEKTLRELNNTGHGITVFGIGTNLVTCQAQPALGGVYKLTQLGKKPRIKLSSDIVKVLIPAEKRAFRLFDKSGQPFMDLLIDRKEENIPTSGKVFTVYDPFNEKKKEIEVTPFEVKEIIKPLWEGKLVKGHDPLDLNIARETCKNGIASLNPEIVRQENPKKYEVRVSGDLYDELHHLWSSNRK